MPARRAVTVVIAVSCAFLLSSSAGARDEKSGLDLIGFWSDDPWPSIWTVRPDGTHRTRILRTRQNAKRPRLSPDGRWVVFDGTRPGLTPISDFDIQLVRRNGRGLRTLTRSSFWDNDAQWSPDGRLISFSRTTDADWTKAWVWTVRPDGTAPRKLARGQFGRWSPDGTRLALDSPTPTSPGDLFIIDADGTNRRLLRASPELDQPNDWSPDGRRILFTRYASTSSRSSIYVVNVDGTGLRRLGPGVAGSFSPDGSRIVYTKAFEGTLFVMRADGGAMRPIRGIVGAEPDWR
jgi:Tol biopolymer transport system component